MNVASLELCKELYELSGWSDTYMMWGNDDESNDRVLKNGLYIGVDYLAPAYDLGYLLRKLPNHTLVSLNSASVTTIGVFEDPSYHCSADSPEDAAAKLAIELFKQGVLTKEEVDGKTN